MVKNPSEIYDRATEAFSRNLEVVLRDRRMNRAELAKIMEKAERPVSMKSIYNVSNKTHPHKIATLAAIAEELELPLWIMLIPELPPELLKPDGLSRFERMVAHYFETNPESRHHIESTAETWALKRQIEDTSPHLAPDLDPPRQ